jgi:hypothetical protein
MELYLVVLGTDTIQHRIQQKTRQAIPSQGNQRLHRPTRRSLQIRNHPHRPRRTPKFSLETHAKRQTNRGKAHLKGQTPAARWPRRWPHETRIAPCATETSPYTCSAICTHTCSRCSTTASSAHACSHPTTATSTSRRTAAKSGSTARRCAVEWHGTRASSVDGTNSPSAAAASTCCWAACCAEGADVQGAV